MVRLIERVKRNPNVCSLCGNISLCSYLIAARFIIKYNKLEEQLGQKLSYKIIGIELSRHML